MEGFVMLHDKCHNCDYTSEPTNCPYLGQCSDETKEDQIKKAVAEAYERAAKVCDSNPTKYGSTCAKKIRALNA
jgi:hypothetical protein